VSEQVLLVDYENVGRVDLSAIPADVRVAFFFGASQRTVPTAFFKSALQLRERFVPVDIEGRGKNALDFHIAFYLGEYLTTAPQTRCVILSNDKGFDPLIQHLCGRNFSVQRVSTLEEGFPSTEPSRTAAGPKGSVTLQAAVEWLTAMQKNRRPRRRKGLVAYLHSHFGHKIPESDIQKLVDAMIAEKRLSERSGTITYHL
jgi:PIN domain